MFILAFEAEEKKLMMEDCPKELVQGVVCYLKEVGCCWCLEEDGYLLEGEALSLDMNLENLSRVSLVEDGKPLEVSWF